MGTPGNSGLKGQWGVGNPSGPQSSQNPTPQDTGSDEQAREFQAAFQSIQAEINGHLQYTSTNAEASKNATFTSRRDALYSAFQSALGKIDRNDPSKAQGDIDQVLGDARALSSEVGTFRQETEQAKAEWDSKQASFDEAVHHVEELETWEDPQAAGLRGQADEIRTHTNERRWREACSALDGLLPALQPVYEEYLKQREAKPQYEQKVAEQSARLEALKGAEKPSQPMTAKAGEADAAMQEAKGKADAKDFVGGSEGMDRVKGVTDELDQLTNDPQRQQYLSDSQGQAQQSTPQPDPAFKSLDADWAAISESEAQAQPKADSGDYAGANQALADSKSKREEFQRKHDELVQKKQEYETALAALQPRLTDASVSDPAYVKLEPMQAEFAQVQSSMEAAAQAGDYDQALTQLQDLSSKLDAFEAAKAEIDAQKQEYDTGWAALQPRIQAISVSDPEYVSIEPQLQEIAQAQATMEASAQSGDYAQAVQQLQDLTTKVDTYEQAKQELDAKKAEYEAAVAALQPKLPTQCPTNAQLSTLDGEITTLKGQMEAAATAKDYTKALEIAKRADAKADEFQKALAEYEKNKQAYETALKDLQPRLPTTCPVNAGLAEKHAKIMALKGQMEAAAASDDYAKAAELAKQLNAKVDDFQKSVKETPPSPEKVKEVQDLIASGKKDEAIQKAIEVYGVDKSQAKKIVYDASVTGEAETSQDGTITVGDKSFSSPGWLASSAAHESEVHVNKQGKAGKWYTGPMGTAIQEVQAYDHEIANAHKYNLTTAEIAELKKRRLDYYNQLDADYKKRADEENYDMKPGEDAK